MDILTLIKNTIAMKYRSRLWNELSEAEKIEIMPEVYNIVRKIMIQLDIYLS